MIVHYVRGWFAAHVVRDTELWIAEDGARTLVGLLVLEGPWLDQLYDEPTMTGAASARAF